MVKSGMFNSRSRLVRFSMINTFAAKSVLCLSKG